MKNTLKLKSTLFILLLIPFVSIGQSYEELREELVIIQDVDHVSFPMNTKGYDTLPRVTYECFDEDLGRFWHVQDLNNDGLNDMIYSGPCKPYNQSAIFMNNGDRLEKVFETPGKLLKIESKSEGARVYVFKESCCCDYYSGLTKIVVGLDGGIHKEVISYHVDTQLNLDKKLFKKSISGVLRSQPVVDDEVGIDPCFDQKKVGNHLYKLNAQKVVVLQSKGGWDLVLCSKDEENSIIGWVKQK